MKHLSFKEGIESGLGYDRLYPYRQSLRLSEGFQDRNLLGQNRQGKSNAVPPTTTVLVVEPDPVDFLAATIAAIEVNVAVILGNPHWSVTEWQALAALHLLNPHQGDLIWGQEPPVVFPDLSPDAPDALPLPRGAILIATGGSGGLLRFAHHTWDTLRAAVEGLQRSNLLPPQSLSSCCLLPLYHVSGFMQFVRSVLTHGDLVLSSSREILATFDHCAFRDRATLKGNTPLTPLPWENYTLSLVPTQLHRFITELPPAGVDWLRRFALIFVGGAALSDPLRHQARVLQLPLAPTYGMTETAGMVATLSPQAFLAGNDSVGRLLPHCQVQFLPPEEVSDPSVGESDLEKSDLEKSDLEKPSGRIMVRSDSLALGYYPPDPVLENGTLKTNDRGWIGSDNFLYIAGRLDRVIITGGEKVYPEKVEAILLETGLLTEVVILGSPHADWGEQVIAFCVGVKDWEQLRTIALHRLSPHQRPKLWIPLESLPRNDRGKVIRSELLTYLGSE